MAFFGLGAAKAASKGDMMWQCWSSGQEQQSWTVPLKKPQSREKPVVSANELEASFKVKTLPFLFLATWLQTPRAVWELYLSLAVRARQHSQWEKEFQGSKNEVSADKWCASLPSALCSLCLSGPSLELQGPFLSKNTDSEDTTSYSHLRTAQGKIASKL